MYVCMYVHIAKKYRHECDCMALKFKKSPVTILLDACEINKKKEIFLFPNLNRNTHDEFSHQFLTYYCS